MTDQINVAEAITLTPETWDQLPLEVRLLITEQQEQIRTLRAQVIDYEAQLGISAETTYIENAPVVDPQDISILIIEDDPSMCRLMEIAFQRVGLEAFIVDDISLSMKVLTEFVPDIIVCDYKMGYITGIDILRVVRNSTLLNNVRFILITAIADPSINRKAKELGANEVLTKPFLIDELIKVVTANLPAREHST